MERHNEFIIPHDSLGDYVCRTSQRLLTVVVATEDVVVTLAAVRVVDASFAELGAGVVEVANCRRIETKRKVGQVMNRSDIASRARRRHVFDWKLPAATSQSHRVMYSQPSGRPSQA